MKKIKFVMPLLGFVFATVGVFALNTNNATALFYFRPAVGTTPAACISINTVCGNGTEDCTVLVDDVSYKVSQTKLSDTQCGPVLKRIN